MSAFFYVVCRVQSVTYVLVLWCVTWILSPHRIILVEWYCERHFYIYIAFVAAMGIWQAETFAMERESFAGRRSFFVSGERLQWLSGQNHIWARFLWIIFGIHRRNSANNPFSSFVSRSFFSSEPSVRKNAKTFTVWFRQRVWSDNHPWII